MARNSFHSSHKGFLILEAFIIWIESGRTQLPCNVQNDFATRSITTNSPNISISCTVGPQNVLEQPNQVLWQWVKLSPDGRSIKTQLGNGTISDSNHSLLQLPGGCETEGPYQALYFNITNSMSCLSSCYIFIQVTEVRRSVLMEEFSRFPIVQQGVIPTTPMGSSSITGEEGSMQSIGRCRVRYFLPSGCEVVAMSMWYYNGNQLDIQDDPDSYVEFSTGELQILNLTESTAGYYVCVTTLDILGESYLTYSANVGVFIPGTTESPTPSTQASTLTTDEQTNDDLVGILKGWQIGLIVGLVSLAIIVLLIMGAVGMGYLTIKSRNKSKAPERMVEAVDSGPVPQRPRQKSMIEEIQLVGDAETDTVDYGGPVEIEFSSILFEELLHKGTFKVVHHATVNQPALGMLSIPVAVKRLKDENSELGYEELMLEASFLRSLQEKAESHPNIVSLVGMTTRGGPTCLLLEYVPNGTLEQFLVSLFEGPIPEWYMRFTRDTLRGAYHKHVSGDLMSIIIQVAEGMKCLTEQGLIHRDLATRNILIGDHLNVKIANPGMLHEGYYYMVTERGHFLQDMAPECQWEKRYSVWSDIWSFGILAYRVVSLNNLPFPDIEAHELYGKIEGGERPRQLTSFSNELYFLLQQCWQFVATERPSFHSIIEDLTRMAEKPTRHIILKATKDCTKPGYISEDGQVFLLALPPHALQEDQPQKKAGQKSGGTIRSLISSIDDTVYTRETAETMLDFTQSENENDNYEEYLRGEDLTVPLVVVESQKPEMSKKRRSYETDTSGNDLGTSDVAAGDGESDTSGKKKKRRKLSSSGSRDKKKKKRRKEVPGIVNSSFQDKTKDGKEASTDDAPSMTEEEDKEEDGEAYTSNPSGSESNRDSKENIVEL